MNQPQSPSIASALAEIYTFFKSYDSKMAESSFVKVSKITRVEPFTLIDSALRTNECLPDLQQVNLAMFSGFYIQAIAIATADKEMKIHEQLEPFTLDVSKDRLRSHALTSIGNELDELVPSSESYRDYTQYNPFTRERITYSSEGMEVEEALKEIKDGGSSIAVGKLAKVTFKKDVKVDDKVVTKELSVPIGIRLRGAFIPSNAFVDLLSFGKFNIDKASRIFGYKTGQLSFFRDIIFCNDIYTQARRNLMKDKTGYFKATMDRKANSLLNTILSVGRSKNYGGVSSIVAMAKSTSQLLEGKLQFRLDSSKQRDDFMTNSGIMIMSVVDEDYRMVKFYFHSVEQGLEMSYNDLKKPKKEGSMNMADIVTALSMGNVPRI